jgi:hypothetical protein
MHKAGSCQVCTYYILVMYYVQPGTYHAIVWYCYNQHKQVEPGIYHLVQLVTILRNSASLRNAHDIQRNGLCAHVNP